MSAEKLPALLLSDSSLDDHAPTVKLRLQKALISCSESIASGDFRQSEALLYELVKFIDSISSAALFDPSNDDVKNDAVEVLSDILSFITSPSLDQAVIDALSFELPKAAAKFAGVDGRCMHMVESVIERLIESCSPRDMLSVLCEALDSPSEAHEASSYFSPILTGLSKVLLSIQRRHFEQVKVAVPVILNALRAVASESDDGDTDSGDLFDKAIGLAYSMQAVCVKLEGKENKKLCALLGLFVLQIMTLISISLRDEVSSCLPLIVKLSHLLPYCGLSYLGLIAGRDVDTLTSIFLGEDGDNCLNCFSYVNHGAALAVIWGHISIEVAQAAEENLTFVKDELRSNQIKRWEAVGMLKHVLSFVCLPWKLKSHALNFLLGIMDGYISQSDQNIDCSSYMPSLFAGLQAVEMVIVYAPDPVLRRNAFCTLKRVLADIPTSLRVDILKALITNSDSSSMIAILVDHVREELRMESCRSISTECNEVLQAENKVSQNTWFWSYVVLEFVELVLRPTTGGPPSFPEHSDAVLSALNLYRFVLITEFAGKTNYTGVLSKNNLQKAYNEWLLPLRTLVTGIMAKNQRDYDQLATDTVCALNPVELVLYRCIELVEERLKYSI